VRPYDASACEERVTQARTSAHPHIKRLCGASRMQREGALGCASRFVLSHPLPASHREPTSTRRSRPEGHRESNCNRRRLPGGRRRPKSTHRRLRKAIASQLILSLLPGR